MKSNLHFGKACKWFFAVLLLCLFFLFGVFSYGLKVNAAGSNQSGETEQEQQQESGGERAIQSYTMYYATTDIGSHFNATCVVSQAFIDYFSNINAYVDILYFSFNNSNAPNTHFEVSDTGTIQMRYYSNTDVANMTNTLCTMDDVNYSDFFYFDYYRTGSTNNYTYHFLFELYSARGQLKYSTESISFWNRNYYTGNTITWQVGTNLLLNEQGSTTRNPAQHFPVSSAMQNMVLDEGNIKNAYYQDNVYSGGTSDNMRAYVFKEPMQAWDGQMYSICEIYFSNGNGYRLDLYPGYNEIEIVNINTGQSEYTITEYYEEMYIGLWQDITQSPYTFYIRTFAPSYSSTTQQPLYDYYFNTNSLNGDFTLDELLINYIKYGNTFFGHFQYYAQGGSIDYIQGTMNKWLLEHNKEFMSVGYDLGLSDNTAFDEGYAAGQAGANAISPALNIITGIFEAIGTIFAIELVPHVPIGVFFLVPLFFGVLGLIIWIWRGKN